MINPEMSIKSLRKLAAKLNKSDDEIEKLNIYSSIKPIVADLESSAKEYGEFNTYMEEKFTSIMSNAMPMSGLAEYVSDEYVYFRDICADIDALNSGHCFGDSATD